MKLIPAYLLRGASALLMGLIIVSGASVPVAEAASSKTKPSITLTSPDNKDVFAKEGSGAIPVAWTATNVRENTSLLIELKHKKLKRGSGVGGGLWQGAITSGDSVGSYAWDIEGEGLPAAGTYKIRAYLQQCEGAECVKHLTGRTVKKPKLYASSKWVNIVIADESRRDDGSTAPASASGPVGVSVVMIGADGSEPYQLDSDSTPVFQYYPTGDVTSCTITGHYQGGKEKQTQAWKNGVRQGSHGQFAFGAVSPYPLQALRSIEVVCGNGVYEASDSIEFTAGDSTEADFKILTGATGRKVYKKGTASEETARSYCSKAYNDPKIHKYTRVQCYWDGEKFEDVREFKG
jgi:hypothetical protein